MKTAQVKLSQLAVNAENPRTISGEKFQLLTKSILVFPKMLELRPVVVSKTMMVLGGNMRTNALNEIAKMSKEALIAMLEDTRDYQKLTDTAKQALVDHWCKWQKNPVATIVNADDLTKDEVKQFVIKDNASFGTWNYDKLTEKWDSSDLNDWGVDTWEKPSEIDDIDGFFESHSSKAHETKGEKLAIIIPVTLADCKNAIKTTIENALKDNNYLGIIVS